jgi:hypothetical protein
LNVGYEAETRVWPSGNQGEYMVAFNIYENLIANGERLVSSPRLKVREGCEGEVTLGDEHSSIKCGALVRRAEKGITAVVRVRIKNGDKKVWTARQTVVFTENPSGEPGGSALDSTTKSGKE